MTHFCGCTKIFLIFNWAIMYEKRSTIAKKEHLRCDVINVIENKWKWMGRKWITKVWRPFQWTKAFIRGCIIKYPWSTEWRWHLIGYGDYKILKFLPHNKCKQRGWVQQHYLLHHIILKIKIPLDVKLNACLPCHHVRWTNYPFVVIPNWWGVEHAKMELQSWRHDG
jgi:hypothetical protein